MSAGASLECGCMATDAQPGTLAVVTMVRDEAPRYLASALSAWSAFADHIIAMDDGSSDDTVDLLKAAGAHVLHRRAVSAAWGAEAPARKALWEAALASGAEWLLWLDADMVPGDNVRRLVTDLPASVDAVAFRLYDLWAEAPGGRLFYRADLPFWRAHDAPRIWMIRRPSAAPATGWSWSDRGLHCGHLPMNWAPQRCIVAPKGHSLLHYGYLDSKDRASKMAAYASKAPLLQAEEYAHALSICDEAFIAFPLPFEPTWRLTRRDASS